MPVVAAVGMAHVVLVPTRATVADLQVAVEANTRHARKAHAHLRAKAGDAHLAVAWVTAWVMVLQAALVAIVHHAHPKGSLTRCALA